MVPHATPDRDESDYDMARKIRRSEVPVQKTCFPPVINHAFLENRSFTYLTIMSIISSHFILHIDLNDALNDLPAHNLHFVGGFPSSHAGRDSTQDDSSSDCSTHLAAAATWLRTEGFQLGD